KEPTGADTGDLTPLRLERHERHAACNDEHRTAHISLPNDRHAGGVQTRSRSSRQIVPLAVIQRCEDLDAPEERVDGVSVDRDRRLLADLNLNRVRDGDASPAKCIVDAGPYAVADAVVGGKGAGPDRNLIADGRGREV